jgi:BirA family biotin operon repressor/biotin-[acetyl-CoA-carboxylase] ligase
LSRIEKITAKLETDFVGREIYYFEKLSSTNITAKEQAEKGANEGTTIIAETQTTGKGRLNRRWFSPKGGVWFSIILRPQMRPEDAAKITLITSVAVAKTLRKLYGLSAEVKWPNDVLIHGKKVCGILTEASLKRRTVNFVVVGIGINANFSLNALPEDLATTAVTTLKEVLQKEVDREELICVLLKEFESCYERFKRREFESLLSEWRSMTSFLGKEVEVVSFAERLHGMAVDIDENGALIIKLEDGTKRKIVAGDVTVREV